MLHGLCHLFVNSMLEVICMKNLDRRNQNIASTQPELSYAKVCVLTAAGDLYNIQYVGIIVISEQYHFRFMRMLLIIGVLRLV